MTRGLNAILEAKTDATCLVGKTWDFHVTTALNIELEENLRMISGSVAAAKARGHESMFDCEHYFDGFKANPDYALSCVKAAQDGGAEWVILCDTNGGSLPDEVFEIVSATRKACPGVRLGIHCHNDSGVAVANTLAAVKAGAPDSRDLERFGRALRKCRSHHADPNPYAKAGGTKQTFLRTSCRS